MNVTVHNADFLEFLYRLYVKEEKILNELRIGLDRQSTAYESEYAKIGYFRRFLIFMGFIPNPAWTFLEDDPDGIIYLNRVLAHDAYVSKIKELIKIFEFADYQGLTKTTQIEYTNPIVKLYIDKTTQSL